MKIVCLAHNYFDLLGMTPQYIHDIEPTVFIKGENALNVNGGTIFIPKGYSRVWAEVELGFVVARSAKNVPIQDADQYIHSYVICNDITGVLLAPAGRERDVHLALGKSCDSWFPFNGPFNKEREIDYDELRLTCAVNERLVQDSNTNQRVYNDAAALAYITQFMTLERGDIVSTGTPYHMMFPLHNGDRIACEIEGIGVLRNVVRFE